jgi:hypothetical protein
MFLYRNRVLLNIIFSSKLCSVLASYVMVYIGHQDALILKGFYCEVSVRCCLWQFWIEFFHQKIGICKDFWFLIKFSRRKWDIENSNLSLDFQNPKSCFLIMFWLFFIKIVFLNCQLNCFVYMKCLSWLYSTLMFAIYRV